MKKNSLLYDDEINLIYLFKTIWDSKIKILLITLISFLAGFVYSSQIPINYSSLLTIKPGKTNEFLKLVNLQKLLRSNNSDQSYMEINQKFMDGFVNELEDYEEFLKSIKNTKKIQEHFLKINIEDQEKELLKYAKLLEIASQKENEQNYIINFKWHNPEEAKKVLQDTLNLVTKNLKERLDLELEQILEFEKKLYLNNDRVRLDYLKEQSAIAKELNILNNQIDDINLSQSGVSLSINTADIAYYLRGYKAIDKEIELIENREYQNFKFIEEELDSFKAQNIKFIDYNIYLMDVKSLKDTKSILIISILLGFIVGIFYVLISNAFQPNKDQE